jgi:hypothetical protein
LKNLNPNTRETPPPPPFFRKIKKKIYPEVLDFSIKNPKPYLESVPKKLLRENRPSRFSQKTENRPTLV